MNRGLVSGLLLLGTLGACKSDAPPPEAPLQTPTPAVASSTPAPPSSAPPATVPTTTSPPIVETAPFPAPIACKTDDDCWFDDEKKPIARPAKLRGRRVTPCKGGEHVPACKDAVCIVRAFKC